jgi:ATP-binding cassette subfamily B protein
MKSSSSRRLWVPEVVQTSAMDCGPATLKALLAGFGIPASYGRLREACHTNVDGSSIDTLEDLANQLGLEAEQILLPVEHVFDRSNPAFPAIAVIRLPSGLTHFVVLWRRFGPAIQIMDPGRGRRFVLVRSLEQELFIYRGTLAAQAVEAWIRSAGFIEPLAKRCRRLGIKNGVLKTACAEKGWQAIAALDATVRAIESLRAKSALPRAKAAKAFKLLWESANGPDPFALIPETLWTLTPSDQPGQVTVRGAILVSVEGKAEQSESVTEDLQGVFSRQDIRPMVMFFRLLKEHGFTRFVPMLAALILAGVGAVLESLLFRGAFDIGQRLASFEQRLAAAGALVILLVGFFSTELPLSRGLAKVGRHLEGGLRLAFLKKLPRLGDAYFQSRPLSAMAESAHLLHWVRLLPGQAGLFVRTLAELGATMAGLIWLHPPSTPLVLLLGGGMFLFPFFVQPMLMERDLRMRAHAGGLARFYLDALLGVQAIRAHTAETPVMHEHDGRLREWSRAALGLLRVQIGVDVIQGIVGFALTALLVAHYLQTAMGSGWAILFVYWAFGIPLIGSELAFLLQQYPQHRNITLRLLEPLGAKETAYDDGPIPASNRATDAVAIQFSNVCVEASGHPILEVEDLAIGAGEHIAVVGASGAGKSSLVGLLLGFHLPSQGELRVDGEPLSGGILGDLRRRTVWVDPQVQLWNRSLLDNLRYGSEPQGIDEAVESAHIEEILSHLPMGLQTPLGAGGGLLSGGEGQRVRIGRAISRAKPRLVILDEAFSGLERIRRQTMLEAARKRWASATFLCITHDVGETRSFPRVLVVEGGRIVEDGSPKSLLSNPGSLYGQLLLAEGRAQERLNDSSWQRLSMVNGQVQLGGRG